MSLIASIDRRFYPGFQRNWDDKLFREHVLTHINSQTDVLDVGAGAGIVEEMNFRGLARRVCGIDLDPRVRENPYLDEGHVADAEHIPYPDASFDVVIADNVMEHINKPVEVLREIARVLRPGGKLLFKTPNRNHYMPLIARFTPYRFHGWINKLRGREVIDTFPTRYLCNSRRQIERVAPATGLNLIGLDFVEGRPEYMRLTACTYLIGLAYERLVNSSRLFKGLRVVMIATLMNPAEA